MLGRTWKLWIVLWVGLGAASAQQTASTGELNSADTTNALLAMAAQAGVIFAGHVVSITHHDTAGYVDVRFAIDAAVIGCASNEHELREWAGLWAGQADRYQVGQRYLMLLHLPGASGMSAPVGGLDGAIPLVSTGGGPLMDAGGAVPADAGPGALSGVGADLRWVQARAQRVSSAGKKPSTGNGAQPRSALITVSMGSTTQMTLESVMAVLRGVGSAGH